MSYEQEPYHSETKITLIVIVLLILSILLMGCSIQKQYTIEVGIIFNKTQLTCQDEDQAEKENHVKAQHISSCHVAESDCK